MSNKQLQYQYSLCSLIVIVYKFALLLFSMFAASLGESAKRRKTDNAEADIDFFINYLVQRVVTRNLKALRCRVTRRSGWA